MDERIFYEQTKTVNTIISIIEIFFLIILTYYTFIKLCSIKGVSKKQMLVNLLTSIIIAILAQLIREKYDLYISILFITILIFIVNIINYRQNIIYTISTSVLSYSINQALYTFSGIIAFIPNVIFKINNDYIGSATIIIIYTFIVYKIFKIKKLKYGINYLKEKLKKNYFNLLIINIGSMILFLKSILPNVDVIHKRRVFFNIIIFLIVLYFIIKQAFDIEYKQNLLEKDLKETKEELETKKQEIKELEKENLEFSKTSHSLAHKQKALEYRLSQLTKLGKINEDEEKGIKKELKNISEKMYKEPKDIELAKTDIPSIDNMFLYMQSECVKDNIKFELQVVGNIHYMVNNLISENELEILIADHLKDAIIAINYSDNSNRSILVRIGKIDNVYSLYIYDSGIEFTKEVLDNLGKKPITTHADTGGTGMGFMNTFDTLNKTKASLIINEIGEPCKDNYTKVLIFKFDNQNEFKVNSYKNEIVV